MVKDSQTRFVSPKAWNRIEQWSRRKPVFALMGEFSAGKSTLMNFLLRKQALPTQVTATQLPPIWFSWGSRPAYVKRHDGSTQTIELNQLEQVGVNDAQFIRIFLKADILEAVDLIDTPGISDPKISTDVWQRAVGQANGVLWCTHSTQAWRETERATWVSLPERLQHKSLLLITRADALGQKDRQKVLRRVNREAGHLFNRTILFSARDAIMARDKTGDTELWSRSGGGKMVDSFLEITEQIMDSRADMLARYQIDKSLSEGPKVQPMRPEKHSGDAPLKLVTPLEEDGAEAESDVITSFPVRPARVERRAEDTGHARIDAEEAERLRAEMTTEAEPVEEDLRALFSDQSDEPLDLNTLANPVTDVDEFDFMDDEDEDQEDAELIVLSPDEGSDPAEVTESAPTASAEVADTSDIEVSVSSITALLAEQSESSADEYEPEPESNSLAPNCVVSMNNENTPDEIDAEGDHTQAEVPRDISVASPLSALEMWGEIVARENLPDDAKGLKSAFAAFLSEFDQIAMEHDARRNQGTLRGVPESTKSGGAEWHAV
ncbi:Dynamin family protein [Ruegeria halocynthiae]|uniref:Dynamin family protein n=1 Tax=Ruegeria halocynthiae TaxID=985054 RepID=A0A1H2YB61_9RHOB|nr:dynamin family protein [Ruegeria halocynthiae]SDX01789.1 Dynamin family protein [Ruegeria halocynthiae]